MFIHAHVVLTSTPVPSGLVVDQTRKRGFAFRNRNEPSAKCAVATDAFFPTGLLSDDAKVRSSSGKNDEFIAVA
jgi:MFS transporter, FHS family, L-fucose permease